jgi:hypothetical protein
MTELKKILMERDGLDEDMADELIELMRADVADGENPEDVLMDWVGLEPDYFLDIM